MQPVLFGRPFFPPEGVICSDKQAKSANEWIIRGKKLTYMNTVDSFRSSKTNNNY
jgi:hypothetical protein